MNVYAILTALNAIYPLNEVCGAIEFLQNKTFNRGVFEESFQEEYNYCKSMRFMKDELDSFEESLSEEEIEKLLSQYSLNESQMANPFYQPDFEYDFWNRREDPIPMIRDEVFNHMNAHHRGLTNTELTYLQLQNQEKFNIFYGLVDPLYITRFVDYLYDNFNSYFVINQSQMSSPVKLPSYKPNSSLEFAIKFTNKYFKNLTHMSKLVYFDINVQTELLTTRSFILKYSPDLINKDVTYEQHYYSKYMDMVRLTTVFHFGDIRDKKSRGKFFESYSNEDPKFSSDVNIPRHVRFSMNCFESSTCIIIHRDFSLPSPKYTSVMFYQYHRNETAQIIKSFSCEKHEYDIWSLYKLVGPTSLNKSQMMSSLLGADKFHDAVSTIEDIGQDLKESLDKLPNNFMKHIEMHLQQIKTHGSYGIIFFIAASALDYIVTGNLPSKTLTLSLGAIAAAIHGPNLLVVISKYLATPIASCFQFGDNKVPSYVKNIFEFIFEFIPDINFRKLKDYLMLISNFERIKEGTVATLNWIFEQLDKMANYMIGHKIIPVSWYKNFQTKEEIKSLIERIEAFNSDLKSDTIQYSQKSFSILLDLIEECNSRLLNVSRNGGTSIVLNTLYKDLIDIKKSFGINGNGSLLRQEPFAFVLRSNPGNFKSTILEWICNALFERYSEIDSPERKYTANDFSRKSKLSVEESDLSNFCYYRDMSTDYYDGYKNQFVYVQDEFGSKRDLAGIGKSEFMEFISLKNTMPKHMHCADLSEKKDVYMRSKFMVLTTNSPKFRPESITNAEALPRRFDMDVIVYPNPLYCKDSNNSLMTQTFDTNLLPRIEGTNILQLETKHFLFSWAKEDNAKNVVTRILTFEEMMEEAFIGYKKYQDIFEYSKRSTSKVIQKMKEDKVSEIMNKFSNQTDELPMYEINDWADITELDFDPKIQLFFDKASTLYGIPSKSYGKIMEDMVNDSACGVQFIRDIISYENIDHWLVEYCKHVPKIKKNLDLTVKSIDQELKTNKSLGLSILEFINSNRYIIGLSTLALGFITAYNLFSKRDEVEVNESQSVVRVDSSVSKTHSLAQLKAQVVNKSQMGDSIDPNAEASIKSIMETNTFSLMVNGRHTGTVTFLKGRFAIMPCHFYRQFKFWVDTNEMDVKDVLYLLPNVNMHPDFTGFPITLEELFEGIIEDENLEARDLVIVKFPDSIPNKKDIVSRFKRESTFKKVYNRVCMRSIFRSKNKIEPLIQSSPSFLEYHHLIEQENADGTTTKKLLAKSYNSCMQNGNGYCGSIIYELNPQVQHKIIGFHVAGVPEKHQSISSPVSFEDINRVIGKYEITVDEGELLSESQMDKTVLSSRFRFIKKAKPVSRVSGTSIVPSKLLGLFTLPTKMPACLHTYKENGIKKDVFEKNIAKYNKTSGLILNKCSLDDLIDSEIDFYSRNSRLYVEDRILSFEEAVAGIPDEGDFSPLSRSTSPGYPYVFERVGKGKHMWFGKDGDYNFDNRHAQLFKQDIELKVSQLKDNILPMFVFIDLLKDELRPLAKIDSGSTRVFSSCPMDLCVLVKMYFGSYMAWFIKNRIDNGSSLGINVYSTEWHTLALKLTRTSGRINAGDFSGFDGSPCPRISLKILSIVESFYVNSTAEERSIRSLLWTTLFRSYHLFEDNILCWDSSLPSGHPLTAVFGTMYNRIAHKYSFYSLSGFDYNSLWVFNDVVTLVVNGDDSLFSVHPDFDEFFNENILVGPMSEIGMVYTPEFFKGSVRNNLKRSILDVMFLKRSFIYCKEVGRYICPLVMDTCIEMPNWTKKIDGDIILQDKCNMLARELSMHPLELSTSMIEKMDQRLKILFGVGLVIKTRSRLLAEVLSMKITPMAASFQMDIDLFDDDIIMTDTIYEDSLGESMTRPLGHELQNKAIGSLDRNFYQLNFKQMDTAVVEGGEPKSSDIISQDNGIVKNMVVPFNSRSTKMMADFENSQGLSTLSRVLGRPYKVISGTFASSDIPTTFSKYGWETASVATMMYNKLQGVYMIKADLVITLECNGNPMQQGLYSISFLYSGGLTAGALTNWNLMHACSKTQITQLPIAYLNVSCDTKVTLTIPWKSAFHGYLPTIASPTYSSPGSYFIYPMVPLATAGGSTTASYTLWSHYENVQFGALNYPQMGRIKKFDILAKEQNEIKPSDVLQGAADFSNILGRVPLLSTIASPLSWFLDSTAGLARAYGFSKPNVISTPSRVVRSFFPYFAVADVGDASEPLSLTAGNHVEFGPAEMGSEVDELSFDYLKQIPVWSQTRTWTTSAPVDTVVNTFSVNPNQSAVIADGSVTLEGYGPAGYISTWFNLWRGSAVYNVKIVKTKFHSGRLMLVCQYADAASAGYVATTTSTSQYLYRQIIDIREIDEFEFTVPYVYSKPWCQTQGEDIASIRLLVLDPLTAPAIVSTTVDLFITYRGGPDLSFAEPCQSVSLVSCVPSAYQMDTTCVFKNVDIGDTSVIDQSLEAKAITQGESVVSFRQLLKRFMPVTAGGTSQNQTTYTVFPPFACSIYQSNGTVTSGNNLSTSRDLYTMLMTIYAFSRGGVRVGLVPQSNSATQVMHVGLDYANSSSGTLGSLYSSNTATINNFLYNIIGSGYQYFQFNNPTASYFIPHSTELINRTNGGNIIYPGSYIGYGTNLTDFAQFKFLQQGATNVNVNVFRSGADDIGFGCFVSIPPLFQDVTPV